jgi:hypothetical protein
VSITPETLAWLRQSAAVDGSAYSQVLEHLLERVEALEQRPIPGTVELDAPAPEAAPVATDKELADCYADAAKVAILNRRDYDKALTPGDVLKAQIRALYDLGRQHGAAQPPAAQPALETDDGDVTIDRWIENRLDWPNGWPCVTQCQLTALIGEALEHWGRPAQPPAAQPTPPPAPAGGLVERVDRAIVRAWADCGPKGEARAAIREVAAWMRKNETGYNAAHWLEQEANR